MSELERIRIDLAHARTRLAQTQAGQRGQHSDASPWQTSRSVNVSAPVAARYAQLKAETEAVKRLELEYVMAMLPTWTAARVIAAMEGRDNGQGTSDPHDRSPPPGGGYRAERQTETESS